MKGRVTNLTEGSIWKQVLLFSLPLLMSNILQQLYSAVDLIIIGYFYGGIEMSSIGATGSIVNMIISLFVGLSTGCAVGVSQYYGAEDYENLQKSIHTAYAISIIGGLILTVLGVSTSHFFLKLMGTPNEILNHSVSYMKISFVGSVPLIIYNMGSGLLRSVGDSRRPFYFLIISTLTNLVLDILFAWIFDWGVAGAAWATIISQTMSAILVSVSLMKAHTIYHLNLKKIKLHAKAFKQIIEIGVPAGIQSMLINFSNVLIQSKVNTFGSIAVGGVAAATKLDNIVASVFNSFSLSATTFSGQNLGARLKARVKRGAKEISLLTFISTLGIGMLIFFLRYPLVSLFTQDQEIIQVGARMVSFLTPFYWILGLVNTLGGYIRGTGESFKPMLISMFGMCLFRLVYLYVALDIKNELDILFLCYPISWTVTFVVMFIYFKKGAWRKQISSL